MASRIKKDDIVKIIGGKHKGTTGKVLTVLPKTQSALVENVNIGTRKVKPSQLNPTGGTKDIHVPISLHKLALVTDHKAAKASRVGYKVTGDNKVRVARQEKNKEIK